MKIFKLALITMTIVLFNNANASLVILNSSESGTSVSSISSSLITGSGSSSSGYCGMTTCEEAYTSYFTVNFDVVGSQLITVNANLNSSGTSYNNQSTIWLAETNLNQTELGAISQAIFSTLAGDDGVTDYAVGSLNIDRQILLSEGNYSLTAAAYEDSLTGSGGANYSFTLATVPVPSAVWLFGSGLIGLIGMARRKSV